MERKIDFTEIVDGEGWELFAEAFLVDMGLIINIGASRGADAGKDLLVSEQLRGAYSSRRFTWLVSCKHYAKSNKSIGTTIETDILDRVKQHGADGFLGFYSTPPSSALIERLEALKKGGDINNYSIIHSNKIQRAMITGAQTKLVNEYFPNSYSAIRPIDSYLGDYRPLPCIVCDKDLLLDSIYRPEMGMVGYVYNRQNFRYIIDVYTACKGECDKRYEDSLYKQGLSTTWNDIHQLVHPAALHREIIRYSDMLRSGDKTCSDDAHKKIREMFVILSQRTLRQMSEEDLKHFEMDIDY